MSTGKTRSKPFPKSAGCILVTVCALLFACNSGGNRVEITQASNHIVDSLVFDSMPNTMVRTWKEPGKDSFNLFIYGKLYRINKATGMLDSIASPFARKADDVFAIGNNAYYDRSGKPKRILSRQGDSFRSHILAQGGFVSDNKRYSMLLYSNSTFVRLPGDRFMTPMLFYSYTNDNTVKDFLLTCGQHRLGLFSISGDSIRLDRLMNYYPRENFLENETRCLRVTTSMCQDKNAYFIVFNFLDTIYQYDLNGKLTASIALPPEFNFRYYDNSGINKIENHFFAESEITGTPNLFLYYNTFRDQLVLVALDGLYQDRQYDIIPSMDEMKWFLSIYDLRTRQWKRIISFGPEHEFRNVVFDDKYYYVKNRKSKQLRFDKYVF